MFFDGFKIIVPGMGRGVGVLCVWGVQIIVFSSVSLFLLIDTSVLFLSFFQNKNFWNLEETVWTNNENLGGKGHVKWFRLFYFWFWIREKKEKEKYNHLVYLWGYQLFNFTLSSLTLLWCQLIRQKAIELRSIQFSGFGSFVSLGDAKGRWKSDFRENCSYIK